MRGQMKSEYISADSVLSLCKKYDPFTVLSILESSSFTQGRQLDYKDMYYNDSVKHYLLKWLDRKMIQERRVQSRIVEIESDTKFINKLILAKLNNDRISLNFVLLDSVLHKVYKDSVINEYIEQYRPEVRKIIKYPPPSAIEILTNIGYPEFHPVLKQYWLESKDSYYYDKLLYLGDPDVRKLFDEKVKEFAKTNGKSTDTYTMFMKLDKLRRTSYGVQTQLETLSITSSVSIISGTKDPFNCLVLFYLVCDLSVSNTPMDYPLDWAGDSCETFLHHIQTIKKAAKLLQQRFDEEQAYWRDNMPFNKNK
jgi:hypothetical protein